MNIKRPLLVFLAVLLLLTSCGPAVSQSNLAPELIIATNVAATFAAMPTFTPSITPQSTATLAALQQPTWTPITAPTIPSIPTLTPLPPMPTSIGFPTLTPIPSLTPLPRSGSSGGGAVPTNDELDEYACEIKAVSPKLNAIIDANKPFTATWVVRNTGWATWDINSVDYRYENGARLQVGYSIYDISATVASESKITLKVNMRAPNNPGTYNSNWVLAKGKTVICKLVIRIEVR